MKKLIAFALLICIALSLCACGSTKTSSSSSSSSSYSSGKASLAEKEEAAENAALRAVLQKLQNDYNYKNRYDLSATRYKTGNIDSKSDNKYTVYLTLYLYDDYGSYKETIQRYVNVTVDDYGKTSDIYVYER